MQPSHAPMSPSSKLQNVPLTQPQADGPRHWPSFESLPKQHATQSSSPSDGRPSWPHAAAEEKEFFDIKLTSFDAKAKIKVIKEVRALTGLGLKEAKEVVEGAPSVLKKEVKKDEAEEIVKKLTELGAAAELE